ncbi:MAG: pilus assembly protein N-terminal domain-containing protein, partial [Sphingomonas sp.]
MRFDHLTDKTAGTAIAAALAVGLTTGALLMPEPAGAAVRRAAPSPAVRRTVGSTPEQTAPVASGGTMTLSIGRGQLVQLSRPITDLFVAADTVADVQVKSPTMIYVFGKAAGQTTVSATDRAGVVWSATIRVGQNITSVGEMLRLAMPENAITATPMNGLVLLTGTVA